MKKRLIILIIILLIISILLITYFNIQNAKTNIKQENNEQINIESSDNMKIYLKVNDNVLPVTLVNNSATDALLKKLLKNDITIEMKEYGNFEKVGSIGFFLPTEDEYITTTAGDLILYQGDQLTIHYASNSWNYTRLGKIDNVTSEELRYILGIGDVQITLSINKN